MGVEYVIRCSDAAIERLMPALALRGWIRPAPEASYVSLSLPDDPLALDAPAVLLNRTPTGLTLTDLRTARVAAAQIIMGMLDELIAADGAVAIGEEFIQR